MLITVVLPLALAFIMLTLGLGLTLGDFGRVLTRPKDFLVGVVCQMLALPLVALAICLIVDLNPAIEVGIMILSFCPGGVTSNMLSRFANADVALSVSLTAVVSLLFLVTLPIVIPASVGFFQGAELASQIDVFNTVVSAFLITAVPVALGVALRAFLSNLVERFLGVLTIIASVLFVLIVLAALASNWALFMSNLLTLGPALVALNVIMLAVGWFIARATGMTGKTASTIAIETGVQNATLGIAVASILWASLGDGSSPEFSVYALPSAVYGITMYLVTAPFIAWRHFANRAVSS